MWWKQVRTADWKIRLIVAIFTAIVIAAFSTSYRQMNDGGYGKKSMKSTDIVAGDNEKNFSERYNVTIRLPMSKSRFLTLLNELGLHYESCGERGIGTGLPVPRHTPTVDLSIAQRCIEVDGDIDARRHIGKRYRAYMNKNDQVFYIENAFSYTGP